MVALGGSGFSGVAVAALATSRPSSPACACQCAPAAGMAARRAIRSARPVRHGCGGSAGRGVICQIAWPHRLASGSRPVWCGKGFWRTHCPQSSACAGQSLPGDRSLVAGKLEFITSRRDHAHRLAPVRMGRVDPDPSASVWIAAPGGATDEVARLVCGVVNRSWPRRPPIHADRGARPGA
jgi:hypothetical protein